MKPVIPDEIRRIHVKMIECCNGEKMEDFIAACYVSAVKCISDVEGISLLEAAHHFVDWIQNDMIPRSGEGFRREESIAMTCRQIIIQKLLRKPSGMMADHFNNRIKDYSWQEIQNVLSELLKEGVIGVTNKRFWIRDSSRAMGIVNEREA